MSDTIHDRGYWLDADLDGHYFDGSLALELLALFAGQSVIDFGCGLGSYVRLFRDRGLDARGYDGNPLTPQITREVCQCLDLSERVQLEPADWVMSLEVGEHLPSIYAAAYLDNVTRHAREGVVLSWAIPGQGGRGHVNCQPNEVIMRAMDFRGWDLAGELTWQLRRSASRPWFHQTLMAFRLGM